MESDGGDVTSVALELLNTSFVLVIPDLQMVDSDQIVSEIHLRKTKHVIPWPDCRRHPSAGTACRSPVTLGEHNNG